MAKTMLDQTELVVRVMEEALQGARRAGRISLTPPDILRSLLDMSEGFHLRVLVDDLGLDMNALRAAAGGWETGRDLGQDWKQVILLVASGEAGEALRPYINTEHVLLALLRMWPEAPCLEMVLRASGGSLQRIRLLTSYGQREA
jgi:hypothetical protein